jgi:hypothetical protein
VSYVCCTRCSEPHVDCACAFELLAELIDRLTADDNAEWDPLDKAFEEAEAYVKAERSDER